MPYERIAGLRPEDLALADSEIPALVRVIEDYKQYLPEERWQAFQTRVAREWAIETGQIEGLYQFDRGLTMTLIEDGITASRIPATSSHMSPEQVAAILQDHMTTLEGLFAFVKGERPLSKSYIHELHQALLRNQKTHTVYSASTQTFFEKTLVTWKYKEQPNNPTRPDGSIFHYCPPEHVEAEMDQLIACYREQEGQDVSPEIQAAWLHHAFTRIHPYVDGNGRVARALATLVLIKGGLMPLIVPNGEKQRVYIPALEKADEGDFGPLVRAFRYWQGRLVVELSQRVSFGEPRKAASVDEFFAVVEHDMLRHELRLPGEWGVWATISAQLFSRLTKRIEEVAEGLRRSAHGSQLSFEASPSSETGLKFLNRLIGVIETTVQLSLGGSKSVTIEFAVGQAGFKMRGLGKFRAIFRAGTDTDGLISQPFLVTFTEPPADAGRRFEKWLEAVLLEGLNRWRQLNLGD